MSEIKISYIIPEDIPARMKQIVKELKEIGWLK